MSSNKSKRLDSKSPYSPYIERESNKDYDNLSHSKPLSKSKRPASAKNNETRSGKTLRQKSTLRPSSAIKQRPRQRSGIRKPVNKSFLGRMRSKKAVFEQQFDKQLALKNKINSVSDENLKFHRKVIKPEKRKPLMERPSPQQKKQVGVDQLKRCVQELRQVISSKDDEIKILKKNLKQTRLKELEIELQAYMDECTRLRHHLEEVVKERDDIEQNMIDMPNGKIDKKKSGQEVDILKEEVKELKQLLKASNNECKQKDQIFQQEYEKWTKRIQEKDEIISKLQGQQENSLVYSIKQYLQQKNVKLADFVKKIDIKNNGIVELSELPKILTQFGIAVTKSNFEDSIMQLFGKTQGKVSVNQISAALNSNQEQKQQQKPVQKEVKEKEPPMNKDIEEKLKHIALRMQLHRIPKQNVANVIFGEVQSIQHKLSQNDVKKIFMSAPLSFTEQDQISGLLQFLVSEPKTVIQLGETLQKCLENWTVFSQEDEANFDKEIAQTISKKKPDLIAQCSKYDSNKSGVITEKDFQRVLQELRIKFEPNIVRYLQLLFYSHKNTLDTVPYRHFIEAYGSLNSNEDEESMQSESLDDEERAQIVRYFLAMISDEVKKSKLTLKNVFQPDENQILYPDMFVKGLSKLGLEIEQDHILIILEALQYEEEDEYICVHFKEFEEIMSHYGVGQTSDQQNIHPEHVQRVSLLDSNDQFSLGSESKNSLNNINSPKNFNPYGMNVRQHIGNIEEFGPTDSSNQSSDFRDQLNSPGMSKNILANMQKNHKFLNHSLSSGSMDDVASNASF